MPAISIDDAAENTSCQVTSRSQNPNLKLNDRLHSHLLNPEKPISLSSPNSNRIEKPNQINPENPPSTSDTISKNSIPNPIENNTHLPNPEISTSPSSSNSNRIEIPKPISLESFPSISTPNSKILIPNPMENNLHKNPSIQVNPNPHILGSVVTLPVPDDSSENSKETELENLNGECLIEDIEMELSPDCSEESLGHIKTSLRSWKRLMRNPNPNPLPVDSKKPMFPTHIKWSNSNSSSIEYPRPKKLAIERLGEDTLPPCQPP